MIRLQSLLILVPFLLASPAFAQNLKSADYVDIKETLKAAPAVEFEPFNSLAPLVKNARTKVLDLLSWTNKHDESNSGPAYTRIAHFGAWINDPNDDNCYNTRGRVLLRDSKIPVQASTENHCKVQSGLWLDPYTSAKIKDASEIQIDHVVPLKNAYVSGAYRWSRSSRCHYANYTGNKYHLLSVSGTQNMSKGDRSPAYYLPPTVAYRCEYMKTWLKIKLIWGLNMSLDEAAGIKEQLALHHCDLSKFSMTGTELLEQRRAIAAAANYQCRQ